MPTNTWLWFRYTRYMLRGGCGRAPDSYHTGTRCSCRIALRAATRSGASSSSVEEMNTRTRWSGVKITAARSACGSSRREAAAPASCGSPMTAPTRRQPGNVGRAAVLLTENRNDLQELHEASSVSAITATLHCAVLISNVIITPGPATGQTFGHVCVPLSRPVFAHHPCSRRAGSEERLPSAAPRAGHHDPPPPPPPPPPEKPPEKPLPEPPPRKPLPRLDA